MALTKVSRGLLTTSIVDNGNATAITIDSSENVGIGTGSPNESLSVADSIVSGDLADSTTTVYRLEPADTNFTRQLTISDRVGATAGAGKGNAIIFASKYTGDTQQGMAGIVGISESISGTQKGALAFLTKAHDENPTERMRIDASGNLLVGATTGSTHIIKKPVSVGNIVLEVAGNNLGARFFNADGGSPSAANTAVTVYSVGATGRSINAAGTVNANGADYAEYEQNNGLTISKGSVVGFKTDGTMTLTFNEAIRFAVKSTNPSFVGGDTWGTEDQVGASIEAARQLVDRIAYSGKVPVNIQGAAAGDYIIAVAADDGSIDGQAVADPDFTQYKLAVGRVNRILDDGRAEIAVIIH